MPVFKRLIQNPYPTDRDLKLAGGDRYKQSTFAKLADVNALAKDQNDQKLYSLDLATTAAGTVAITTKRGVVKLTNGSTSSATITLTLTNSELLAADVDKYFIQATIASSTSLTTPSVRVVPVTAGQFQIVVSVASAINWSAVTLYINYTAVKIGD